MHGRQLLEVRIREARLRAHAGATKHPPGQGNQGIAPYEGESTTTGISRSVRFSYAR